MREEFIKSSKSKEDAINKLVQASDKVNNMDQEVKRYVILLNTQCSFLNDVLDIRNEI
jgi:Na+/phosphate symporter